MISYDPGYWSVACIFQLRGSVFPKAMVWAIPCTIVAGLLHHIFHKDDQLLKYIGIGSAAATVFGGFNFILGFLVVFRAQQAYSRWWEGGTLLLQIRGEWFNSFSCLMAFCNSAPEKAEDVAKLQQQFVRLFSLLYACALGQVSQMDENRFQLLNMDGLDSESLKFLQKCPDKCEMVLQWIQRLMVEAEQKALLKIAPPILSRVYNELGNGIVNLNNARKIKEFLIPFPIAQMVMVMLMFHAVFVPLICASTIKTPIWASLLTFVVEFSYWSILYIALELEMPFGDDPNDLPLRAMALDMNASLSQMLEPLALKVPDFKVIPTSAIKGQMAQDESNGQWINGWRGEVNVDDPQMYMLACSEEAQQNLPKGGDDTMPVRSANNRNSLTAPSKPHSLGQKPTKPKHHSLGEDKAGGTGGMLHVAVEQTPITTSVPSKLVEIPSLGPERLQSAPPVESSYPQPVDGVAALSQPVGSAAATSKESSESDARSDRVGGPPASSTLQLCGLGEPTSPHCPLAEPT